ncbi:hypothetical protein ES708_08896 [subsurface metagenome]
MRSEMEKGKKIKTVFVIAIILIMSYTLNGNLEKIQMNEKENTSLIEPNSSTVSMGIIEVGEFNDEEMNGAWTMGVHVVGDYAYVVSDKYVPDSDYVEDYTNGLEIIDISDPTNPVEVVENLFS